MNLDEKKELIGRLTQALLIHIATSVLDADIRRKNPEEVVDKTKVLFLKNWKTGMISADPELFRDRAALDVLESVHEQFEQLLLKARS